MKDEWINPQTLLRGQRFLALINVTMYGKSEHRTDVFNVCKPSSKLEEAITVVLSEQN